MKDQHIAPSHAHHFASETSSALGHIHEIQGFTYPVNGTGGDGHRHRFQGITRAADGHFHRFMGMTGPAIIRSGGKTHVHAIYFEVDEEPFEHRQGFYGTRTDIERHTHRFAGLTGLPIGFEPPLW